MGGRCSSVAALGANMLKLKPCIEVKNGKMVVGKKYRGVYKNVLESYVMDRLQGRTDIDPEKIFITHPPCEPWVVVTVYDAVKKYGDFQEILETEAGCSVSNHCGPNTIGILFERI
jgi:fatty acid-binding protein DegV